MRIRTFIYITVCLSLLALGSCRNRRSSQDAGPAARTETAAEPATPHKDRAARLHEKIRIHSVESVSGSLGEGMVVRLRAVNETGYTFTLAEGRADVYMDSYLLLNARLKDKVTLPRRSDGIVELRLDVSLRNPIAALSALPLVRKKDFSRFALSLEATVSVAGRTLEYSLDRVPAAEVMKTLGI